VDTGLSAPTGTVGATGDNTAFTLSLAEAWTFAGSNTLIWNGTDREDIDRLNLGGQANADYISTIYQPYPTATYQMGALLRTYGRPTSGTSSQTWPFYIYYLNTWDVNRPTGFIVNTGNGATRMYYAQPAVWIKTSAAESAGMFSNR